MSISSCLSGLSHVFAGVREDCCWHLVFVGPLARDAKSCRRTAVCCFEDAR